MADAAFSVAKHVLYKDGVSVPQRPSPNHGGLLKASVLTIHFTGGPNAKGAINALTNGAAKAKVSAHLVVDRDGSVTQLLPFNVVGWHVGVAKPGRGNSQSIGIEMVNCGLLAKSGAGGYVERLGNTKIKDSDVIIAKHKNGLSGELPWQVYPLAQYNAMVGIARAICQTYGIKIIVGHDDVCVPLGRKIDPGPAWNMSRFTSEVLGRK